MPKNILDPSYTQNMIRQISQALIFLISLAVVGALSLIVYTFWGNPFEGREAPVSVSEQDLEAARATASGALDIGAVVNGVHVESGLVVAEGFETVRVVCTACHSGKLVTQNRASRDGWEELIRWMQRTQGLWELGDQEAIILDYLAANYAPQEVGRRAHIDVEAIEWYLLEPEGE